MSLSLNSCGWCVIMNTTSPSTCPCLLERAVFRGSKVNMQLLQDPVIEIVWELLRCLSAKVKMFVRRIQFILFNRHFLSSPSCLCALGFLYRLLMSFSVSFPLSPSVFLSFVCLIAFLSHNKEAHARCVGERSCLPRDSAMLVCVWS